METEQENRQEQGGNACEHNGSKRHIITSKFADGAYGSQ
jgi:hypothetical protein